MRKEVYFKMLEVIMAVITCLSPIIVAYFGYMSSKQQKQTKEFIELQTKYNQMNESNKKKELEDQKNAIAGIQQSVKDLQDQMNDLKMSINIDDINIKLKDIIEISQVNFEYSQSLSQVICAIGDCIDGSNVDKDAAKSFKHELNKHQENEREYVQRIFKKVAY